MPNWRKLIVSGSDASLNSLNVTNNVTAQSFTGSFSGSFTAPGATTQVVYNSGGVLAASSNFVFSGSNVGIGTATPTQLLDIQPSSGTPVFRIARTGGTDVRIGASITATGGLIGTYTNSPFDIYTNSTSRVRVTETGDVGIGTTSPSAPLTFGKSVYATPTSEDFFRIKIQDLGGINNDVGIGQPATEALAFNTGAAGYTAFLEGTNGERMRIANGGNVGIGTTTPGALLQVGAGRTTADALIRLGVTYDSARSARGGVTWHDNTNTTGKVYTEYDGAQVSMVFGSLYNAGYNSNQLMIIRGNGNVGVGTTSPTQKLDVAGAISVSGSVIDYETSPGLIGPGPGSNIVSFTPGTHYAAFVDYVIKDSSTGANQRVGTIMISISLAGAAAVMNEVVTADIGNTSAITFSVTYGAPTWLVAANSGITPFDINYMVRYF